MKLSFAIVVCAVVLCAATASQAAVFTAPSRPEALGWQMVGKPELSAKAVELVFAVAGRNMDEARELLMAVSDPDSPMYGRRLTLGEVGELTGNLPATTRVVAWLRSFGVAREDIDVTPNGDFVTATMDVRTADKMLRADFREYTHPRVVSQKTNKLARVVRTMRYELPEELVEDVDMVAHTTTFPNPTVRVRTVTHEIPKADQLELNAGRFPAGYVQPKLIWSYYGIGDGSAPTVATTDSTQAVYENLGQSYGPSDLSTFLSNFSLPAQTIAKVIGPNAPSMCTENPNNCIEADLDVEYIIAVANNAPTTFWSIPNEADPFVNWIKAVNADANAPFVHSISYGDIEQSGDPQAFKTFNDGVMKAGLRGISVFVASGDDGVANFQARNDKSKCGFHPSFPATAPYVTAVGATQGPEDNQPEVACSSKTNGGISSGGGFSTVFARPSYQDEAVKNYLANGVNVPPTSQFESQNRGYPDVSALGHNYITVVGDKLSAGSGTSASTPVFAAMITLINAERLQAGKKTLGFLNPALYKLDASVWNDITSGENNCCAETAPGQEVCCEYGFTAGPGWDPITGLGSPKFEALKAALVALP